MPIAEGDRTPEMRRTRLSLEGWRARKCSQLPGGERSNPSPHEYDWQLEAALYAERNAWDVRRRQLPIAAEAWFAAGGLAGDRRLDRRDAERLWSAFCASLAREVCK